MTPHLTGLVESRLLGDGHGRFGGRVRETDRVKAQHRALTRSYEKHFLSATHYSTNAFFRHQLGGRFTEAQLGQTIYPTFAAAREGTRE